MIIKLIWVSIMFLITIGALFIAAIGFDIPVAYYERSENIIPESED